MKVRCVSLAFVSAAFLAAFATNGSSAFASSLAAQTQLTRQAYEALQSGNTDAAISSYTSALESGVLEPEVKANALLNRALAFQQKGDDQAAIADYNAALALDVMAPQLRATALYNRGLSQQKTGNVSAAIEDFTSALLLNPEFAHAYYSRGNALRDNGQLLFALSDYERALRYKHPDAAKVYFGEALTFRALNRPVDARKALEHVLEVNPQHAAAQQELAKLNQASDVASLDNVDADPVLTGSVTPLAGGTTAIKPDLPKAVDVPANMMAEAPVASKIKSKPSKKITDRVPTMELASAEAAPAAPAASAEPVTLADVPAIPAPDTVADAPVETASAAPAAEPVLEEAPAPKLAEAEPAPAPAEAADDIQTASVQPVGWAVQIASANSEDAAWSSWKKIQKTHKALEQLKPVVVRADLAGKGTVYRVRLVGFKEQGKAKSACSTLKSNGIACYVSKG